MGGWARLPVLVDDTFSIADPMVIAGYLEDSYPRPSLLPSGARGRAEVRMAMLRIDADLLIPVERWAAHREGPLTDLEDEVREALSTWNSRLGDGGLIFGTEMSLADIWLVAAVEKASLVGARPPPELGNLARWRARMLERASVRYRAVRTQLTWVSVLANRAISSDKSLANMGPHDRLLVDGPFTPRLTTS